MLDTAIYKNPLGIPKGKADRMNWSYGHNFLPVRYKFATGKLA